MINSFRHVAASIALVMCLCSAAVADTYRVGPAERHKRVSTIAARLRPGDVVEITGDITDSFTLSADGYADRPITVRGITRIENGRVVRPRITPPRPGITVWCKGDWNVLEGLELVGRVDQAGEQFCGIKQSCDNLLIRNCVFRNFSWKAIVGSSDAGSVTIEFCEFESSGVGDARHTVDLWSWTRGAIVTVQHCYFHDGTGGALLKTHAPRNVIRYNWFESPYHCALAIVDSIGPLPLESPLYPMHSDIVGNVFVMGWSPGDQFAFMRIGGEHKKTAGTEGNFNIAHNLFLHTNNVPEGFSALDEAVHMRVLGNIDNIRLYNNVFLEAGVAGAALYSRGKTWDTPRTVAFQKRRGHGEPIIDGSNNWISGKTANVPDGLRNTIRGRNPGFVDLVNLDFHPGKDSELAGSGLRELPAGDVGKLVPEYEPQRGIPVDMSPVKRKSATSPAIGPFAATDLPADSDGVGELLLSAGDNGTDYTWPLAYGRCRQKALAALREGNNLNALAAAKGQFVFSPLDDVSMKAAVESVKEMLIALHGDGVSASAFEEYARLGPWGEDGKPGTEDDIKSPIDDIPVLYPHQERNEDWYKSLDRSLSDRAAMHEFSQDLITWYDTGKAFARLEGGRVEEAMEILVAILGDVAGRPAAHDTDNLELLVNQDILDRVTVGLSVAYRTVNGTIAGMDAYIDSCRNYAKYGSTGPDNRIGTEDDLAVPLLKMVRSVREEEETSFVPETGNNQAGGDVAVPERLQAIEYARRLTVLKLGQIAKHADGGKADPFLFIGPTAGEMPSRIREEFRRSGPLQDAFDGGEGEQMALTVAGALEVSDRAVVDAYKTVLAAGVKGEAALKARAYLSAYVVASHNALGFAGVSSLIARELTGGELPVFLLEDMIVQTANVPEAMRVFRMLDSVESLSWPEGERVRLLGELADLAIRKGDRQRAYMALRKIAATAESLVAEKAQFRMVEIASRHFSAVKKKALGNKARRTVKVAASEAAGICAEYVRRFPEGNHTETAMFLKGIYEHERGNEEQAIRAMKNFRSAFPHSRYTAQSLLVEGIGTASTGDRDAAIAIFENIVERYPDSATVPKALLHMGRLHLDSNNKGKAKEIFHRICDFYPETTEATSAKEYIRAIDN